MRITKRRLIFKISTARLKKAKWNLRLSLSDAKNNNELIALSDSQAIRWIDELNGAGDFEAEMRRLKYELWYLAKQEDNAANRHKARALHDELEKVQFMPDYVHIVASTNSEYMRAVKGFRINGVKFARLVGTNGGLKNSTVVFVNEKLVGELRRRMENGRDQSVKQVPGKFEAYRALVCSGSIPVSMPRGVIVVNDCMTKFREDIIMLNDEGREEPLMTEEDDYEIELDESDGYGMMSPELAERWSKELRLGYISSGFCLRNSYTKGMVFPFDFLEFAERVAGKYEVTDAWGDVRDIREAELILTTSQLKLWAAYPNMETYFANCAENHYTFAVTKTAPEVLEDRRATNYQFLQGLHLSDEQIEELIAPTVNQLKDVLAGDYRKAILFMCGIGITDKNIRSYMTGKPGALIAEPEMFKDPNIKRTIYSMIKKRIDEAKIGVLDVHANYSIIGGDPYALCQSMFGMPVTGLLKAGEIWNEYWYNDGAVEVIACRAPMSVVNNERRRTVCRSDEAKYWFRFLHTVTMLNGWDTCRAAENGADCDGDMFFLTDNRTILNSLPETKTIYCVQRNAEKHVITEEILIASNLASFGDDIGKTTNKVTAMYDILPLFDAGSREYKTLEYRIMSGQLYQQNAIDKIKGIVCNPMPRKWYDYHANALPENATEADIAEREFNLSILADKKPYFMVYIYPTLMKQYKTYIKNVETKCVREFRLSLEELLAVPHAELTEAQESFISYYRRRLPVGTNDCVMNRICRRIEKEFDGQMRTWCEEPFDYTIMRSGAEYTPRQFSQIKKIYEEHNEWLKEFSVRRKNERVDRDDHSDMKQWKTWFVDACMQVNNNGYALCDMVLDLCYSRGSSKEFAWDIASPYIVANLAKRNNNMISYPVKDPDGDIEYGGARFSMHEAEWVWQDTEEELIERNNTEREGMGEEGD